MVFVLSSGGAIGSMVGQIARALGGRVVGSTRSWEKADRLVSELGYVRIKDQLARSKPEGLTGLPTPAICELGD